MQVTLNPTEPQARVLKTAVAGTYFVFSSDLENFQENASVFKVDSPEQFHNVANGKPYQTADHLDTSIREVRITGMSFELAT